MSRLWHRIQWWLFPIGLLAAAVALLSIWSAMDWQLTDIALPWLLLAAVLHLGYVALYGVLWHIVTRSHAIAIPLRDALPVYLSSIVGKYLPFRISAITHRAACYVHVWKRPLSKLVQSAAYESILATLAGVLVAAGSLLISPLSGFALTDTGWLVGVAVIGIVVLLLHPAMQQWILHRPLAGFGFELAEPLSVVLSFGLLLAYGGAWLVLGTGLYWLAIALLGTHASLDWLFCVQVYAIAGAAGMLVVVVPSGIGIREGVMTTLLLVRVDFEIAILLTLSARLMITAAELLLAMTGGVMVLQSKNRTESEHR